MQIDRAYLPVETLGPGRRLVVWVQGCTKQCQNCSNPELWPADGGRNIEERKLAQALIRMAAQANIKRITFTGGDPLEQAQALIEVLRQIRPHFCDILIYSGYTLNEINDLLGSSFLTEFKKLADALIDGPYIASLNDGKTALMGSTNQKLHVFNEKLIPDYEHAQAMPRRVQNVMFGNRSLSIGIHQT